MFKIRNFGTDTECDSIVALANMLHHYRGKSITVDDRRADGKLHFLDVTENGELVESYGQRRTVTLETLLQDPSASFPSVHDHLASGIGTA